QEIYRGAFEITLPYARTPGSESLELTLGLRDCADIGLCYPPQRWSREVALPAAAASGEAAASAAPAGSDTPSQAGGDTPLTLSDGPVPRGQAPLFTAVQGTDAPLPVDRPSS